MDRRMGGWVEGRQAGRPGLWRPHGEHTRFKEDMTLTTGFSLAAISPQSCQSPRPFSWLHIFPHRCRQGCIQIPTHPLLPGWASAL